MKLSRFRPLLRCRLVCAAAVTCSVATMACATNPIENPGIPQSCGMQLKNHNFTTKDLAQVHELGFGVVRKGMYWHTVEKTKGSYEFDEYDRFVDDAERLGLTVVACLFGENKIHEDDGEGGIQTEAGRKGFANFAAAMAERYKGRNIVWEIWNEPNVRTFWRKSGMHNSEPFAEEYTLLVKETVAAMLKADPGCFVAAGAVSNYWQPSYEWTEYCFQKGILQSGIRGWSVHPYGVKTPEEYAIGHGRTRDLLRQYGAPDMPIINTERGYAVEQKENTAEGWSGGEEQRALEHQAWHFVRQVMADQMHDVRMTVWYEWDGGDSWTGSALALVTEQGPRPSGKAAKAMFEQLNGYRFVRRLNTNYPQDYALLFARDTGERKLVVWTAPEAGEAPEKAIPHDMQISTGGQGGIAVVDLYGASVEPRAVGDGHSITVSGAPAYVAVPADSELTVRSVPPPKPQAIATPTPVPASANDLALFQSDSQWKFVENTGKGSFRVREDGGVPIGTLSYDFTTSNAKSTPYVLAVAEVNIPEGAQELRLSARSGIKQRLTFRVNDATGQTHQYKTRVEGTGGWENLRIPLTQRLEHWGGANDGKIHFPITSFSISVPLPSEEHKTGTVDFAAASVQ